MTGFCQEDIAKLTLEEKKKAFMELAFQMQEAGII